MFSGGGMPVTASRGSRNYTSGGGAFGASAGMPRVNNNTRFFSAPPAGGARAGTGTAASGFGARANGFAAGGASAAGSQAGGWQRFSPSTSGAGTRSFQRFDSGAHVQNSAPRSQGFQNGGSQPVRISPQIVNNRSYNQGGGAARNASPSGSFGGPRPGSSGNGGGGFSAPRAPSGGFRGPSGGGGGHAAGGGGHAGHR
jgi:hypothetical protein